MVPWAVANQSEEEDEEGGRTAGPDRNESRTEMVQEESGEKTVSGLARWWMGPGPRRMWGSDGITLVRDRQLHWKWKTKEDSNGLCVDLVQINSLHYGVFGDRSPRHRLAIIAIIVSLGATPDALTTTV